MRLLTTFKRPRISPDLKRAHPTINFQSFQVENPKNKLKKSALSLLLLGVNIGARVSELTALQVGDVWHNSRPVDVLTLRKQTVKGKKDLTSYIQNKKREKRKKVFAKEKREKWCILKRENKLTVLFPTRPVVCLLSFP